MFPHYVGPFEVLKKVDQVAYHLVECTIKGTLELQGNSSLVYHRIISPHSQCECTNEFSLEGLRTKHLEALAT